MLFNLVISPGIFWFYVNHFVTCCSIQIKFVNTSWYWKRVYRSVRALTAHCAEKLCTWTFIHKWTFQEGVQCANYLYSGFDEVQSEGQGFPHEDVWVVGGLKGLLQLLQLPAAVVGPCTTLLHWPLFIWKAQPKHQLHNRQRVTRN